MKNKKAIVLMWLLSLLPFLLVAFFWGKLPDQVPIHWNAAGQVDSYASKGFLWLFCVISPVLALFFQFLPKADPKKENYEKFQGKYDLTGVLFPCITLLVMGITISEAINPGVLNVSRLIMGMISVIFILVGNFMGKVKTNWFIGFRTPWALSDPDVWNKTQRLGGWTFFLSGLSAVILSLLAPVQVFFLVFFAILFLGIALTYFMSWKWFKDKERQRD